MIIIRKRKIIADPDSARRRIRGRFVNDHTDAAEVDVAVIGDELDGGRSDVDGEILLDHSLVAVEEIPQRAVPCADAQDCGAFFDAGKFRRQSDSDFLLGYRLGVLLGGQRVFGAACRERYGNRLQSGALIGNTDLHGRQAKHVGVRRELDLRCLPFEARSQVVRTTQKPDDNN